jgi:TetR/AcrR family transcriptional repressor of nem operon
MNAKEQQKAESRERILKAASGLFREKGYHATGVDELMEKAGLTAGAFYAHFKSKKQLLAESLSYSLERNRSRLLEGTEKLKGAEFVSAILAKYVSELHRDHPEQGCPLPALAAELPRHSKETAEIVGEYLEKWIEMLLPHVEGTRTDKRREALRLLSQAVGAVLLSRMTFETKLSKEILKASQSQ